MIWLSALGLFFFAADERADAAPLPADKLGTIFGEGKIQGIYSDDMDNNYALINQLVTIGMADSPTVQTEQARFMAAKSAVDAALAAYQPTALISASLSRSRSSESTDDTNMTGETVQAGATLRHNIWRGGADDATIRAARADQDLADLQMQSQQATAAYEISRSAISYHAAAIQQKIAAAAAEDAREILSLSEKKFKAGQAGKLEVYRASMRASEAEAAAARAEVQVNQTLHLLLKNLSRTATGELVGILQKLAAEPIPLPKAPPPETPTPETFSERIAATSVEKSEALLNKSRKSRYFPEIDLVAGFTRNLSTTETSIGPAEVSSADKTNRTTLALELNWALWTRPRDHQITQAWYERQAADARAAQAKLSAYHAREETYSRLKTLYQSLPALRAAFTQADELYQAQRTLYDAGAVDVFAVNDADSLRVTALKNWYDVIVEIHQTYIKITALKAGLVVTGVSGG